MDLTDDEIQQDRMRLALQMEMHTVAMQVMQDLREQAEVDQQRRLEELRAEGTST